MAKWKLQLSTTEPNNDVGLIKINQDDENSQTFEAEINEFGNLKDFSDREVYFNAKIGPYKVRDKVPLENIYYDSKRVVYTLIAPFLQKIGEFDAWFSFKKSSEDIDEFSTTFFNYKVVPGITKNIFEGNYLWDMEELLRYYHQYKNVIAEIIDNKDLSSLVADLTDLEQRTDNLDNYATATKQEAVEAVAPNKLMTPIRTKQQVDARVSTSTDALKGLDDQALMTPLKTSLMLEQVKIPTIMYLLTPSNFANNASGYGQGHLERVGDRVFLNARWTSSSSVKIGSVYTALNIPEGYRCNSYETVLNSVVPNGSEVTFSRIHTNSIVEVKVTADGSRGYSISGSWVTTDPFPDDSEDIVPRLFFIDALDQLKSTIDSEHFTIGFVTDSHFDEYTWRKNADRTLKNLNNALYLQNDLDCIVVGGDNVDSEHPDKSINKKNNQRYVNRLFRTTSTDKFITRGNHDQGSLPFWTANAKVMPSEVITRDEFKTAYQAKSKLFNETRNGDSLYCFKDYPEKKIRLIVLDSIDNPEVTNSDGSLKYFDQWDYGYQQPQLKWVAEQALGTCPDDYHVVFMSHIPLRIRPTEEARACRNFQCMIDIINAFIDKKSKHITSTTTDFLADFDIDFTNRNQSNVVGFFAGHAHLEQVWDNVGFKTIVCDNAWPESNDEIGLVIEDSFCLIDINIIDRKISLKGFGRSTDRTFSY